MTKEELLKRLDIILSATVENERHAFNSVLGSLIRLNKYIGDKEIEERIDDIVYRALEHHRI